MDFDYWLRLGVYHALAYLPARLATLRMHATAKSVQKAGIFGPELIYTYRRLFDRQDLPKAVRDVETEAMSSVYYLAAYFAFWAGQFKEARRYGFQSWRYRPRKFRRLWFFLPLGKLGLKMAEMRQSRAGIVTSPTQL
jgi:hypothetical protein